MKTEYEQIKQILESNDINELDDIEYGGQCYDELMDYFADEMPYGVMKARTGMPDEWIIDRIFELDLLKDTDEKAGLESHYYLKDMI